MSLTAIESLSRDLASLTLPDTARVWIYVANRAMTAEERLAVEAHLAAFTSTWVAHGSPLAAEAAVLLDQVVVLTVDETVQTATGCSIDASVAALRALPQAAPSLADLDLFDRSWVLYAESPHADAWQRIALRDFWALRKAGKVEDETVVFDTTVNCLGDLRHQGAKAFASSWHAAMW